MVLSWFASKLSPIAVDIGTDTIKLLQAEPREGQFKLAAAACEVIPEEVRKTAEREAWITSTLQKMMGSGFRGKQVITCLPSSVVAVQHLRVGRMGAEELAKALPFEAAGKLPFDPNRAMIKHTIAGDVYDNNDTKQEVIVLAAPRDAVERHLALFSKLKLEVVGIHVEPNALIECFGHIFRRKGDENICTMFIDMGAGSTHVVIAHGKNMVFAKHVAIGGDLLNRQVADALKITLPQAKDVRIRASRLQATAAPLPAGVVGLGVESNVHPLGKQNNPAPVVGIDTDTTQKALQAIEESTVALINELKMCMRYYEGIFPGRTVDRAIFVGGESRHIPTCKRIAQSLGLPATLGDPLARLAKDQATQTNVDLRQPQPAWAIAVGLALGLCPTANEQTKEVKA